jgi:alkylglycerol monooxygenase
MAIYAWGILAALFFIAIEIILAKKITGTVFSYKKIISNLSIGAAERLFNIWLGGMFYFVFRYIYNHFALLDIASSWYNWVVLLLLTDFIWYWYHRSGHEINILWAFHIVHHQSEDFNYTTSTRITVFQAIVRNIFWCILPFIGFPPEMIIITLVIHGGYSFFIHTELVGKLGWIEKVFITPSHHRVHHASNTEYLDKNYGDMFVFWDKLFGTFKEEDFKPIYGITKPLKTHSFLWQHFHYLLEMLYRFNHTAGFKNKLKIVLGKPEVMLGDEREIVEAKWLTEIQPISVIDRRTGRYKRYINIQFAGMLIGLILITLYNDVFTVSSNFFFSFILLLTLINCCALLEQKKWIFFVEYVRIIFLLEYIALQFNDWYHFLLCNVVVLFFTLAYNTLKKKYMQLVYHY